MSRLLDLLRKAVGLHMIVISIEARWDASWFVSFLSVFNDHVVEVDSCLKGAGGISKGQGFYAVKYPDYIARLGLSISSLECLNLLFAVCIWGDSWQGTNVLLFCNNMAIVCAVGSARAEDPLIRGAVRELWWWSATRDFELTVRHRPGAEMEMPDMLSWAYNDSMGRRKFDKFIKNTVEKEIVVGDHILMPPLPL